MNDEHVSPARTLPVQNAKSVCGKENASCSEICENIKEKENVRFANAYAKRGSSRKRPKGPIESSKQDECDESEDKAVLEKKRSNENMPLETKLSSDTSGDDLAQGPPLGFKNFFKVVKSRTFSNRLPKTPKPRLEPKRETKDTDVIVFERPTTPQGVCTPGGVSRSLAPILDFRELVGSDTILDDDDVGRVKPERLTKARTTDNGPAKKSIEFEESQAGAELRTRCRPHRCSRFMRELAPDALQEFGSFDFSSANRGSARRISRKSFGYLYGQLDEHETLQF